MPELPEVEVVKEGLKKIVDPQDPISKIHYSSLKLRNPYPRKMDKLIRGQKILNLKRRAKYILMETQDYILLSHLGMTGTWREIEHQDEVRIHDHVVIEFKSQRKIIYNDPRRFGVFDIIPKNKLSLDKRIKGLGPEPFDEASFTEDYLYTLSRKKSTLIKPWIMDQKVVVGVGNIYASEALFKVGLHPKKKIGKVGKEQYTQLILQIRETLRKAIIAGGSTIRDFEQINGNSGYFQNEFQVYGRQGEACLKCSSLIKAQVLAGRNTFWCVKCQK